MSRLPVVLLSLFVLSTTMDALAADKDVTASETKKKESRRVFISLDDAGDEYPLQGEYSGTVKLAAAKSNLVCR